MSTSLGIGVGVGVGVVVGAIAFVIWCLRKLRLKGREIRQKEKRRRRLAVAR
jgi:hypothetical protein